MTTSQDAYTHSLCWSYCGAHPEEGLPKLWQLPVFQASHHRKAHGQILCLLPMEWDAHLHRTALKAAYTLTKHHASCCQNQDPGFRSNIWFEKAWFQLRPKCYELCFCEWWKALYSQLLLRFYWYVTLAWHRSRSLRHNQNQLVSDRRYWWSKLSHRPWFRHCDHGLVRQRERFPHRLLHICLSKAWRSYGWFQLYRQCHQWSNHLLSIAGCGLGLQSEPELCGHVFAFRGIHGLLQLNW